MARRLGDPATLAEALSSMLAGAVDPLKVEERLALAEEAVELADRAGDRVQGMRARMSRLTTFLTLGDISAVNRDIEAFTRLAEELREPSWLWVAALFPPMRALLDGRIDDAERLAQEALAAGQRTEGMALLRGELHTHQGVRDHRGGSVAVAVRLRGHEPPVRHSHVCQVVFGQGHEIQG